MPTYNDHKNNQQHGYQNQQHQQRQQSQHQGMQSSGQNYSSTGASSGRPGNNEPNAAPNTPRRDTQPEYNQGSSGAGSRGEKASGSRELEEDEKNAGSM